MYIIKTRNVVERPSLKVGVTYLLLRVTQSHVEDSPSRPKVGTQTEVSGRTSGTVVVQSRTPKGHLKCGFEQEGQN